MMKAMEAAGLETDRAHYSRFLKETNYPPTA